jgi:uncharacterized protein YqgC (DUF456 family)
MAIFGRHQSMLSYRSRRGIQGRFQRMRQFAARSRFGLPSSDSASLVIHFAPDDDSLMQFFWYYLFAVVLTLVNIAGLASNFLTLPGNWIIVAASALFAWLVPHPSGSGLNWWVVGVVSGLALLGEVVEFAAGAAGAAKSGGSKRGIFISMLGTMVGSIVGAMLGTVIPIPIVGNLIGAVLGGALGAFGGAYLGEYWKGKPDHECLNISSAAMIGRVLGTVGKLAIGVIMVIVTMIDVFFN